MNQSTKNDLIGVTFFIFVCTFSILYAWVSQDCPECPPVSQCIPVEPAALEQAEPEITVFDV